MKCPLLLQFVIYEDKEAEQAAKCIKKECPWWSSELDQCDPTGLLPSVKNIESFLGIMADKMASG